MSLGSSPGGIKEDSFLLNAPAVPTDLGTGQEVAAGSTLPGSRGSKLRAPCHRDWTHLGADSTPRHAKAPRMVSSTLPGLIPFISPLRSGKVERENAEVQRGLCWNFSKVCLGV